MPEDKINESEQWKTNGDCRKCRRAAYCTKRCKAAGTRFEREFTKAILGAAHKVMSQMPYDG